VRQKNNFVDQTTFEKLGGEASTSLLIRFDAVIVMMKVFISGFVRALWFQGCTSWVLIRISELLDARPLAAAPSHFSATFGTCGLASFFAGWNWRHEAMSIKL